MTATPISAALTSMLGLIKAQHRVDRAFLAWADKIEARVEALEALLADAGSGGDLLTVSAPQNDRDATIRAYQAALAVRPRDVPTLREVSARFDRALDGRQSVFEKVAYAIRRAGLIIGQRRKRQGRGEQVLGVFAKGEGGARWRAGVPDSDDRRRGDKGVEHRQVLEGEKGIERAGIVTFIHRLISSVGGSRPAERSESSGLSMDGPGDDAEARP